MADIVPIEFLQALYREPVGPGKLLLWTSSTRSGKKHSYWLNTLDEAVRRGQQLRASRDVYFGVALHDVDKAVEITRRRWPKIQKGSARPSEESAVALPALYADLAAGEAAGGDPLPERATLELLPAVPAPVSIIVKTGGGYQVYWLLREPWILETDAERRQARELLRRLRGALLAAAREKGWAIDVAADLARVQRLPGTLDHQPPEPASVTIEHFPLITVPSAGAAGDFRYEIGDFAGLPEAADEPDPAERLLGEPPEAPPPADFKTIYQKCGWLAHCYEDRRRLPEVEWQAALGIVGRTAWGGQDGRRLAHRFSADHPGYTARATDEKLDLALQRPAAQGCRQIAYQLGAYQAYCRHCALFGHVRSPLDAGLPGEPAALEPSAARPEGEADPESEAGSPVLAGTESPRGGEPLAIEITTREHEVNDQALAALAARERNLFERAGELVHVIRPQPAEDRSACRRPAGSVVRPVQEARARELLARHCAFVKRGKREDDLEPAHPPRWTVRALLSRGSWPELPTLEGVVECPVLRADGSVLQSAGYDAASGLFLAPSVEFHTVPEAPTEGQLNAALAAVREPVRDFPFVSQAHRAAWLSSLLTPLARAAFEGPSPLNLIDANIRGSGKSLLADVCSMLLTGRTAPRMSYSGNEDELRKAITSMALEGTRLALIDNVSGVFGSPTLDRALTAETWRDRLLGGNEQVAVPLRMTWYATGNNVVLASDTPRRCLHIRLQSSSERPEKRSGLRHPRLLAWLRRERPRLLPAALTLLRGYLAAGKPDQNLEPWGSYEDWSDLVRSCVVWLGLPDPAATREQLEAGADTERGVIHDLVHGLAELLADLGGAATAKEILEQLAQAGDEAYPLLRSALAELFPRLGPGELPRATQLAGPFRSHRGRIVRGACIEQASKSYRGARWTVRKVCEPDPADHQGETDVR